MVIVGMYGEKKGCWQVFLADREEREMGDVRTSFLGENLSSLVAWVRGETMAVLHESLGHWRWVVS